MRPLWSKALRFRNLFRRLYGRDVTGQEAARIAWTRPTVSCSLPGVLGMRR